MAYVYSLQNINVAQNIKCIIISKAPILQVCFMFPCSSFKFCVLYVLITMLTEDINNLCCSTLFNSFYISLFWTQHFMETWRKFYQMCYKCAIWIKRLHLFARGSDQLTNQGFVNNTIRYPFFLFLKQMCRIKNKYSKNTVHPSWTSQWHKIHYFSFIRKNQNFFLLFTSHYRWGEEEIYR